MSNKVTIVQTVTGSATAAGGFVGWLEANATVISLGFTAATFVVFCISTYLKHRESKSN